MPKLVLKFEQSVLKEVPVGTKEVSIGRAPDNGLVIDNPAVSNYHARVFNEEGRLMLEDFGSLNGTFVNGQRIKMVTIKPGDSVLVGKHSIVVTESREPDGFADWNAQQKPFAPKINETVMLDTKDRRNFLQQAAAIGESAQVSPTRVKVAWLVVQSGKTDQREYILSDKLVVIGKSAMATVKLKGWFKPKVAAQITRRDDNSYYIGPADQIPSVNGNAATHATKLSSGDVIEVAGVHLEFAYRE
ncbi:MAG TPA: FHA domain-containing protein [Candidatus Acidoferrum sp.]|nr:FHA domain-containing protein [Candidatus Acidoferrum sp.]